MRTGYPLHSRLLSVFVLSSESLPPLRYIAIEALCDAMLSMDSDSGTEVFPDILVRIRVWLISGKVYSSESEAAAPKQALTPGQTS